MNTHTNANKTKHRQNIVMIFTKAAIIFIYFFWLTKLQLLISNIEINRKTTMVVDPKLDMLNIYKVQCLITNLPTRCIMHVFCCIYLTLMLLFPINVEHSNKIYIHTQLLHEGGIGFKWKIAIVFIYYITIYSSPLTSKISINFSTPIQFHC